MLVVFINDKIMKTTQVLDKLAMDMQNMENRLEAKLTQRQQRYLEETKKILDSKVNPVPAKVDKKPIKTACGFCIGVKGYIKHNGDCKCSCNGGCTKLEALVATNPAVDAKPILECMGECLDENDKLVQHIVFTTMGDVTNHHGWEATKKIRWQGKLFAKPKVVATDPRNSDRIITAKFDGPTRLHKKHFEKPTIGTNCWLVVDNGKINHGKVDNIDEGAYGVQLRCTYTSVPTDCGSVIINANSRVIGLPHFSAGKPNVDNLSVPVTDWFLDLFTNPKLLN
jgi:hypothetical protein